MDFSNLTEIRLSVTNQKVPKAVLFIVDGQVFFTVESRMLRIKDGKVIVRFVDRQDSDRLPWELIQHSTVVFKIVYDEDPARNFFVPKNNHSLPNKSATVVIKEFGFPYDNVLLFYQGRLHLKYSSRGVAFPKLWFDTEFKDPIPLENTPCTDLNVNDFEMIYTV